VRRAGGAVGLLRVDLHVHTTYSDDCLTTCFDVLRWAKRRRLSALAITDHNTIAGALALCKLSSLPIIVGEEIRTSSGEIIGLFLKEEVPADLPPKETVHLIREQGGLVYVPHPLDRVRRSVLDIGELMEVIGEVDLVEVFNARVTFPLDNRNAEDLARRYGLLRGAGSDAHQGFEIGQAYVEMPSFSDAQSFLRSLAQGQVRGRVSSPLVHVGSTCAKLAKGLMTASSSLR